MFHMAYDGSHTSLPGLRGSYNVLGYMVLPDWIREPMKINRGHDIALLILDKGADGHFPGERTEP